MPISAVLLDLDETLIVEEESNRAAFAEVCALAHQRYGIEPEELARAVRLKAAELWRTAPTFEYCLAIGISSWEGLWGPLAGEHQQLKALAAFAPAYRVGAWSAALESVGVNDHEFAKRLAASFVESRALKHFPFDDTIPALQELSRDYRLAIVTNGAPMIQRVKIVGARLPGYFAGIAISGEIGFGKPDERIFDAALKQIDASPESAVMVGDNLKRDIGGAKQIGIKAIWMNRAGKTPRDGSPVPDAEIRTLLQLPDLIRRLSDGDSLSS